MIKMDLISIPNDILFEINKHLSFIDTWCLRITSKHMNNNLKPTHNINKVIFGKLENIFGPNTQNFIDNLTKYNNFLSGSFILNCIYGYDWNVGLDVFFCKESGFLGNYGKDFIFQMRKSDINFKKMLNYGYEYDDSYCDYLETIIKHYQYNSFAINHYNVYIKKKHCDSVCGDFSDCSKFFKRHKIKYKNIFQYIEHAFDIDICKIAYDGKQLYIKYPELFIDKKPITAHNIVKRYNRYHYDEDTSDLELLDILLNRIEK